MPWPTVALSEVIAEARSGFASGQQAPSGVFQIRMNNVTREGRWDFAKQRRVPATPAQVERFSLRGGDVLFNATNSPDLVGKTAVVQRVLEPTVFSNHFIRLRPTESLDSRYLARWLQGQFGRGVFRGMCKQWVNQATVGREALLATALPMPPVEEQRRIADILDRADDVRAKRREALALLDDLTQSIFLDMFGDPLANPHGLPYRTLGELGDVITGNTPPRSDDSNYGHDIEWIKSDNLGREIFATQATERLSVKGRGIARLVRPGAVLITCIAGTPASIGGASIADREVAFNQQINAMVLESMDPMFLWAQLRVCRRLVQQKSTGGMKGMVSKSQLKKVAVLSPSKSDQRVFNSRLARVLTGIRVTLTTAGKLDDLFQSLQQQAFAGLL